MVRGQLVGQGESWSVSVSQSVGQSAVSPALCFGGRQSRGDSRRRLSHPDGSRAVLRAMGSLSGTSHIHCTPPPLASPRRWSPAAGSTDQHGPLRRLRTINRRWSGGKSGQLGPQRWTTSVGGRPRLGAVGSVTRLPALSHTPPRTPHTRPGRLPTPREAAAGSVTPLRFAVGGGGGGGGGDKGGVHAQCEFRGPPGNHRVCPAMSDQAETGRADVVSDVHWLHLHAMLIFNLAVRSVWQFITGKTQLMINVRWEFCEMAIDTYSMTNDIEEDGP